MTATMTDEELELHIQDCGRHMLEAMAQGRRQDAEEWLQAQNDAIASRSPAQVARMERERGLDRCETFDHLAERDLLALQRRQAA
jgi:hypothetical protein